MAATIDLSRIPNMEYFADAADRQHPERKALRQEINKRLKCPSFLDLRDSDSQDSESTFFGPTSVPSAGGTGQRK